MSYNGQQQNYYCDGYGYTYAIYPQYGYQPTPPTYEANNYYPENHYYNQQYTTTVPEYPHVPEGTSIPPPKISQKISFTPVNADIANQVRAVCELCFSNNGLSKEPYLVRQLGRSAKGYISIKLIASMKKVRKITRNLQVVVEALRNSEMFEVSDDGNKARRKEVLPDALMKPRIIATVLAICVNEQEAEIDRLSSIFKKFGTIQQMRVVRPDRKLPTYLQGYATQVPELGKEICAIVEYDSEEAAMAACRHYHMDNVFSGMRVALLGPRIKRNLYGSLRRNSNGSLSCQSSVISSLDVSLEECVITDTTDTDSGIFNPRHTNGAIPNQSSPRLRVPSGSSESNTPPSDDDESEEVQTPPSSPDEHVKSDTQTFDFTDVNKKMRRRNSEKADRAAIPSSDESSEEEK